MPLTARLLISAALIAAPTLASAKEWRAPEKWRGKWKGETVVTYVHPDNLVRECNKMFRKADWTWMFFTVPPAYGCTLPLRHMKDGVCRIIVTDRPMAGYSPAEIIKHEQDHCAGWPVNHPDEHGRPTFAK